MTVYMIGDRSGRVKIGHARNVDRRVRHLQIGHPEPLEVIRIIGGAGRYTERWLHDRFSPHRYGGEWFTFHADMLKTRPPHYTRLADMMVRENFRDLDWQRYLLESLIGAITETGQLDYYAFVICRDLLPNRFDFLLITTAERRANWVNYVAEVGRD